MNRRFWNLTLHTLLSATFAAYIPAAISWTFDLIILRHHLLKLSAPAPKPPRRTLQPSQLEKIPRPPPPRILVEDDSAVTAYPRAHAAESAAAATAAPAAEAPTPASVGEEPPFGNMNQRFEESAFEFNEAGNFNVIRDVNDF